MTHSHNVTDFMAAKAARQVKQVEYIALDEWLETRGYDPVISINGSHRAVSEMSWEEYQRFLEVCHEIDQLVAEGSSGLESLGIDDAKGVHRAAINCDAIQVDPRDDVLCHKIQCGDDYQMLLVSVEEF